MREHATGRGWTIAAQTKEIGSRASEREQRERLLAAARRREGDFPEAVCRLLAQKLSPNLSNH